MPEFIERNWFPPALVFVLAATIYAPTLFGGFYYDDNVVFFGHQVRALSENPFLIFQGEGLQMLPGSPRSLHIFFLMIIYKLFGASPWAYHLFTLLAHSAGSALVYYYLSKVSGGQRAFALSAALIFALHPIHVENITFVTLGGTDVFYTLFALLSLTCYVLAGESKLREKPVRKVLFLGLTLLFLWFSLLSKESALTVVLLFPLTDWAKGGQSPRRYLWALLPLGLLLALRLNLLREAAGIILGLLGGGAEPASTEGLAAPGGKGAGLQTIALNLGFFVRLLVLPWQQSPIIKEFGPVWMLWAFPAGLMALSGLVWFFSRSGGRLMVFSAGFFFFTSIPYLYAPFARGNIAISAERYLYGPSVGFAALCGAIFLCLSQKEHLKKALPWALLVLLGAYSAAGIAYFYDGWRNEEAFWRRVVKTNPDYVTGYPSVANFALKRGEIELALGLLGEGLKKPKGLPVEFAQTAHSIATIYMRAGNARMAETYNLLAIEHNPYEFSYRDLGFIYLSVREPDKAVWAFEQALRFPTKSSRAYYGLARAWALKGDRTKARTYAVTAVQRTSNPEIRALATQLLNELR